MKEASELERVLRSATLPLERLGIAYHITGGLASSYYGEPRFTQDIDFVVQLHGSHLDALAVELEPEFLFDLDHARKAVSRAGLFQALHRELLIKIDFHVGEGLPGELGRSQQVALFPGLELPLVSKEDAVLSKLLWVKQGSGKSQQDIIGMILDPTPFDREFVAGMAEELGCADLWSNSLQTAKEASSAD